MKTSTLRDAIWNALFVAAAAVAASANAQDLGAANATSEPGAVENAQSPSPEEQPATPEELQAEPDESAGVIDMASMTVTGTRIRGGTTPSPVISIGIDRIRQEGFSDLGEVIRSVPQNFSGGQNPGVIPGNLAGAGLANNNLTGGSGLNLRGLGPDASLTLLNGRRMPYGGFVQAVDISAIPTEAIDRIEIVADGASAIYGSDAVGGVGNVILRRDFEGVAVRATSGTATAGGMTSEKYAVTAGTSWSGGGVMAAFEHSSVDPIHASERSYTDHLVDPTTIYPGSSHNNGLLTASHGLTDALELRVDALESRRKQHYNYFLGGRITFVNAETRARILAPSLVLSLPQAWELSLSSTWGEGDHYQLQSRLTLATGEIAPQINDCYCNDTRTHELSAEGPVLQLPGGEARLAVGAGHRKSEFSHLNRDTGGAIIEGAESSKFLYGEINLPLVAATNDGGAPRLEVTAAGRHEDYGSYGSVTTPKAGLIYRPARDATFKASWGKSFKMPTLFQRYSAQQVNLTHPSVYGGTGYAPDAQLLLLGGGNKALDPERATTWTASVAYHPARLPGLEAELTYFDVNYKDRVMAPIINSTAALSDPVYEQFIVYQPSAEEQLAALAAAQRINNFVGVPHDPDKVVALVYAHNINVSQQRVRGIDLSASYRHALERSSITIRGSASWLDSEQQTSPLGGFHDLAGTLHHPAKLNSRLGMTWTGTALSTSVFANYTGGVTSPIDGKKGASFTTFDVNIQYNPESSAGFLSGVELSVSAKNLLNRSPPLYTPTAGAAVYLAPYDSTNYSPIGRYVALSVAKRW